MPGDPVLAGKVVVVTGAGRGLGRAYALDAAAAGAQVVVNDIDETACAAVLREIEQLGGVAEAHVGDVSGRGLAAELVRTASRAFGRLDGLVNNAGVRPEGPAWAEDPDEVRRAVEVNLLGSVLCGIAALAAMREQGSGAVVNVSSRAQSGIPASATYAATKGALASLTYSWALDMQPYGVRVNAIAPQAAGTGTRRAGQPIAGEPLPEEMAPLVTYLLSDRSQRVTGQVVRLGRSQPSSLDVALMSHPRTLQAYGSEAGWSVDALTTLFDSVLGAELVPVGAVEIHPAYRVLDGVAVSIEPAVGL